MMRTGIAISKINVVCPVDEVVLVVAELEADCVAAAAEAVPDDESLEIEVFVTRVLLGAALREVAAVIVELESLFSWP